MGEAAINKFINSRVLTWLTAVVGIAAAYAMLLFFGTPSVPPVEGLFGGGLDHLLPSAILSWAVNMVVVFVAAVMLNWLNKTYVFIREHTMMFVTVFLCATLSNPVVSTSLGTPTLLALALVVCTYVMFGTFQQRDSQSVAFLITMILTVCAMQSFVFALYIPVFIVGFFQMRIFTLRTLLAVLVGNGVWLDRSGAGAPARPAWRHSHAPWRSGRRAAAPANVYGGCGHDIRTLQRVDAYILPPATACLQRVYQRDGCCHGVVYGV